jgi:hypothetical protein
MKTHFQANEKGKAMSRVFENCGLAALFIAVPGLLTSCSSTKATALPESFSVQSGPPEDISADGETAFVSSLADASVLELDLGGDGTARTFVPAATDEYSSGWGLRIVKSKSWLLNVQNKPYDFKPEHAQAGRVTAFALGSGKKVSSWALPEGAVGNSVDVDPQGNIYVGDIGPAPRIIKIDPSTDDVTVWATSDEWVPGGFGIGGMVYGGDGFYAAHDNSLWYVAVAGDGSAAKPARVKIEGNPIIFADGMAWVDGEIVYAENDVLVAGAHGAVYRVSFSDPTTARRDTLREGLSDPSGVTATSIDGKTYLLVNESQLGFAFGIDQGGPKLPYRIDVIEH